ncbi:MAG: tRNA preQ1(34) S-adenosylmethionine ribosyltransferase-isomerase QueA [Phycisphaerae bacterium]
MTLRTSDFDFDLPPERIAQTPLARRDQSRLAVLRRAAGSLEHRRFADLPDLLDEGDLLVLNDTRVVPARFHARRKTSGRIEGLFLRESVPGVWECMLRNAGRCTPGETLALVGAGEKPVSLTLAENHGQGRWTLHVSPTIAAFEILDRAGQTPLPPYIRRDEDSGEADDRRTYQTVFAQRPGAVAAPTAGLHFTPELLERLTRRGVQTTHVTLHVGLGTFAPVKTDELTDHPMHSEWYELSAPTAETLNAAHRAGRRIIAVGTTAVRVLETAGLGGWPLRGGEGWTDIFLYPPADFAVVDGLITNFHLPRSTLVMLVAAFCEPGGLAGREMILDAYRTAIEAEYRFYSYGDAMLIL